MLADDVLVSIYGHEIASDGTVPLSEERSEERLPFQHLISAQPIGKKCGLIVLRKGEELTVFFFFSYRNRRDKLILITTKPFG